MGEPETTRVIAPDRVRVVLVDDHDLFRTGLRTLLEEQGVDVVGEAARGDDAIELAEQLAPDVVLMDLDMPGMGGVAATRLILAATPMTKVLVLTISEQDGDVMDAIVAGACGYLLKDSSVDDLLLGIESARAGKSLISPAIAVKVLQRVRASSADPDVVEKVKAALTARELEVLRLITSGKDNAQIASDLYISSKTVKNHISNILAKLQISNRIQAAVYAVKSGLS